MKGISEIVKNIKVPDEKVPDSDLDLKEEVKKKVTIEVEKEVKVVAKIEEEAPRIDVGIVDLSTWFNDNIKNFPNIKQVKVSITGIDPNRTLIYSEPDPTEEDVNNRKLQIITNATESKVPNIPGTVFENYLSGIRVIHSEANGKIIKSYIVKNGIIITHCVIVDEMVIPIKIEQISKKAEGISFINVDVEAVRKKLDEVAYLENIQIQYKQIHKFIKELKTVRDATKWLLGRQVGVEDINHHLKLDELIISLSS